MPANRVIESFYLGPFSDIEKINVATAYKPGEVGTRIVTTSGKEYQFVQLDSGATSSTTAGAVAVGQIAYWRDKANYKVTNNAVDAIAGTGGTQNNFRNEVAGVFVVAATAGYYCVVQQKGRNTAVVCDSASYEAGDALVASTTTAKAARVAAGTAPTVMKLGTAYAATSSAATVGADLDIPGIP